MYISTYIIDITALFYLIGVLNSSAALNVYRKKSFLMAIILTIIIILSEVGTIFANNGSLNIRSINIFCNILGFALTPLIPLVIILIFDKRIFITHKLWLAPTLINIVATVLSPLFKYIFYIDGNNEYIRGDYFLVFIVVYFFNFLLLIISTLDMGGKYNYPIKGKIIALYFFTMIGTSIQLVNPSIYLSWHCVTLAFFLYFIFMCEFDSSFDTLTGLYNRATFDKAIKEITRPKALSIIIFDINDFKSINDTYGHNYGDRVIKAVALIIRKTFNTNYKCYRYGGDEFLIISNETNKEKIELHLSVMTKTLSTEILDEGNILPTVSYGYSIFSGRETFDFNRMFKEADKQMYHFKKVQKAEAIFKAKVSV